MPSKPDTEKGKNISALRTSLDFPPPILKALDELASQRFESRSVIIRDLIVKGLRAEGLLT